MTPDEWMRAAAEEYRRLLHLLNDLTPDEWAAPTDCTGWDVRAAVAHLVGSAESAASVRESVHQQRRGRQLLANADMVDALNEVQVRERADHSPARLLSDLVDVAPRAVRARTRMPRLLRSIPMRFGPPLGTRPLG